MILVNRILVMLLLIVTTTVAEAQITFGTNGKGKVYINPHGDPTAPNRGLIRMRTDNVGNTIMSVNVGGTNLSYRKDFVVSKRPPMSKEDSIKAKKQYDYYMRNNIYAR